MYKVISMLHSNVTRSLVCDSVPSGCMMHPCVLETYVEQVYSELQRAIFGMGEYRLHAP